jgi:hypothetical protein
MFSLFRAVLLWTTAASCYRHAAVSMQRIVLQGDTLTGKHHA